MQQTTGAFEVKALGSDDSILTVANGDTREETQKAINVTAREAASEIHVLEYRKCVSIWQSPDGPRFRVEDVRIGLRLKTY